MIWMQKGTFGVNQWRRDREEEQMGVVSMSIYSINMYENNILHPLKL
jgi:hypothetical protein